MPCSRAVHCGVDSLNVVGQVGRLMEGRRSPCLAELLNERDLILLNDKMLGSRGRDTVRVTKVKGHADAEMVRVGQVREIDRIGNAAADDAADFGRRRVDPAVLDARRSLSGVCRRWYPCYSGLASFFIAVVVDHDGGEGAALDSLIWSAGALPKRRRLVDAVRNHAMLPGLAAIWTSDWVSMPPVVIAADDVSAWPYSVGILVELVAFLSTLHWPASGADLGVGGVSYVELLLLNGLWAGERLVLEKALPWYRRPGRPISVSAVPFGPGIDILAIMQVC